MDERLEGLAADGADAGVEVEPEAEKPDAHLEEQRQDRKADQSRRRRLPQPDEYQVRHRQRRRGHRDPLGPEGETVLLVVEQREQEIACEPAGREHRHPLAPAEIVIGGTEETGAVGEQQEPDPGVGERRHEGRRVDQSVEGEPAEEGAFEVQDRSPDPHPHRERADHRPGPPHGRSVGPSPGGEEPEENEAAGQREPERQPFHRLAERVDRVGEEDVHREEQQVPGEKDLEQEAPAVPQARKGQLHRIAGDVLGSRAPTRVTPARALRSVPRSR